MGVFVPPEGSLDATIAIVGEGPGYDELRQMRPFVGKTGGELNDLLHELGLHRSQVYLTNVEKTTANKPDNDRKIQCAVELVREFERMPNLNVIVPLGAIALETLGAWKYLAAKFKKGQLVREIDGAITRWRGSIIETFFGVKMVPTYHPSFYMHGQTIFKPVVLADLQRALEQSSFHEIRAPRRTFNLAPSYPDALAWLHYLEQQPELAIDIETFGWGWGQTWIACIGFAPTPHEAFCIPLMQNGRAPYWTHDQEMHIYRALSRVLVASCKKYFHNGMFDIMILNAHGLKVRNFHHDTMLSHHLMYPELKHGLDFVCSMYTEEPYYKEEGKSWSHAQPIRQLWEYNCKDVCVTLEAGRELHNELVEKKQDGYFYNYVMPLVWPLMEMQRVGIRVDKERLGRLSEWLTADLTYRQDKLNEAAGFKVNVKSPKDIVALFDANGIRITQTTKLGAPKLDEDSIREYCRQAAANRGVDVTVGDEVLDIRELRTLLSNFVNIQTDADDMYHFSMLVHGTRTGRLSSRSPRDDSDEPLGPQMQNIPHSCRGVFMAAPGKIFVSGDLKQAEAVYVAGDAQDALMMDVFNRGEDIHKFNGGNSFDKAPEDVNKIERDVAKRITHGFDYGMSPRRAVMVIAKAGHYITEAQAKRIQMNYFAKCPRIPAWQERISNLVRTTKTLWSPFGRRRVFLGSYDDNMAREAMAQNPQAAIAEVTNRSIITLYERLPAHARVVLQVHDEVVVECDEDKWEEVAALMKEAMTIPFRLHDNVVTIKVDIQRGKFWHSEMEEVKSDAQGRVFEKVQETDNRNSFGSL